nr:MAG TPA: hypothetical protein [Caudoviricetes sp.]
MPILTAICINPVKNQRLSSDALRNRVGRYINRY